MLQVSCVNTSDGCWTHTWFSENWLPELMWPTDQAKVYIKRNKELHNHYSKLLKVLVAVCQFKI